MAVAKKSRKEPARSAKRPERPVAPAKPAPGPGDRAPAFRARDQQGRLVASRDLRGKPFVLYFYPKDDTPGCTREACAFRDLLPGLAASGVDVLGVSPDSEASHARFAAKYELPFRLLADEERRLAVAYGVWVNKQSAGREHMGIERSTFLIDASGRIRRVWRRVQVDGHVQDVLGAVAELAR